MEEKGDPTVTHTSKPVKASMNPPFLLAQPVRRGMPPTTTAAVAQEVPCLTQARGSRGAIPPPAPRTAAALVPPRRVLVGAFSALLASSTTRREAGHSTTP